MYIKGNVDTWEIGDKLIGECVCNPDKTIELIYKGFEDGYYHKWEFPFPNIRGGFTTWGFNPNGKYDISTCGIPNVYKLNQYHKWRRVPFKLDWTKSNTPKPDDYEIGDRIRIRGFEFEIRQDHEHLGDPYIEAVSPTIPRKKVDDTVKEITEDLEYIIKKVRGLTSD